MHMKKRKFSCEWCGLGFSRKHKVAQVRRRPGCSPPCLSIVSSGVTRDMVAAVRCVLPAWCMTID